MSDNIKTTPEFQDFIGARRSLSRLQRHVQIEGPLEASWTGMRPTRIFPPWFSASGLMQGPDGAYILELYCVDEAGLSQAQELVGETWEGYRVRYHLRPLSRRS